MLNRFAQPLYGKIIFIYETTLKKEELSTIFSPSTYWIDVTGIDCEVGYIIEYVDGGGLRFVPPPKQELTFEEERIRMLERVDVWTKGKITSGFISSASGEEVYYDSDKDTQLTMQGIALNVNSPLFEQKYPQGCPVRGIPNIRKTEEIEPIKGVKKQVFWLTAEQVLCWMADLSMHIGNCKQAGWQKQAEVNACQSVAELDNIILN